MATANTGTMQGRDVFLRITDPKGASIVQHSRAWDVALFIASVQRQYREQDEKEADTAREQNLPEPGRHSVTVTSEDVYRSFRWAKTSVR